MTRRTRIRKTFTFRTPVLQAIWCSFADYSRRVSTTSAAPSTTSSSGSSPSHSATSFSSYTDLLAHRYLCVLREESLDIYGPGGDVFAVALPYKASRVWPLLEGILIERQPTAAEVLRFAAPVQASNEDELPSPTMFTLLHPLEEVKPVSVFLPSPSGFGLSHLGDFIADPAERIVFTSATEPLIFTYNSRSGLHTLWVMRQSRLEATKRMVSNLQPPSAAPPASESFLPADDTNASFLSMASNASLVNAAPTAESSSFAFGSPQKRSSVAQLSVADAEAVLNQSLAAQSEMVSNLSTASSLVPEEEQAPQHEEEIVSEILLERVYVETEPTGVCTRAFLASDCRNRPLFCNFKAAEQRLEVLALEVSAKKVPKKGEPPRQRVSASLAYTLPAASALPVRSGRNLVGAGSSSSSSPSSASSTSTPSSSSFHSLVSSVEGSSSGGSDLRPYDYDVLLLDNNGAVSLWCGDQRMCSVKVAFPREIPEPFGVNASPISTIFSPSVQVQWLRSPTAHPSPLPRGSPSPGARNSNSIVDLRDPVGDRVTIVTSKGALFRAWLPTSFDSPVVSTCFAALSCALPPELVMSLRIDHIALRSVMKRVRSAPAQHDWLVFDALIRNLLKLAQRADDDDAGSSYRTPAARRSRRRRRGKQEADESDDEDPEEEDAWAFLLQSEFHRQHATEPALGALKDSAATSSKSETAHIKQAHLECLKTDGSTLKEHFPAILWSLHMVYEDFRLNVLNRAHLPALASLLLHTAVTLGFERYAFHYVRDFGHLAPLLRDVDEPNGQPPPDVFAWLVSCLRGHAQPAYPWFAPFSVPFGFASPCELSRKLCRFYMLIGRGRRSQPHPGTKPAELFEASGMFFEDDTMDDSALSLLESPYSPGMRDFQIRVLSPFMTPGRRRRLSTSHQPPAFVVEEEDEAQLAEDDEEEEDDADTSLDTSHVLSLPRPLRPAGAMAGGDDVDTEFPVFAASIIEEAPPLWPSASPAERLVLAMVEEGFTLQDIECIPFGVALPLREALRSCREHPPGHWPQAAYELIGRQDLAKLLTWPRTADSSKSEFDALDAALGEAVSGSSIASMVSEGARASTAESRLTAHAKKSKKKSEKEASLALDSDGTLLVMENAALRFSRDRRLHEVRRLLLSNKVLTIRTANAHTLEDESLSRERQLRLLQLAARHLGLPIGRGMFTMASLRPVLTDVLPIPPLKLVGRVPPKNVRVDVNVPMMRERHVLDWPDFHNGVAAGLRVSREQKRLTRTWIVYNRPQSNAPTFSHAGFLMALGLQGHLTALAPSDLFWYLSKKHDATTIGLLLGMSAARRGSMDTVVSKMLCLHIPALLPAGLASLQVSALVQASALLGVGLLYEKSAHRLMTEILLAEIARPPSSEHSQCREAYALSAGVALGLVVLQRGGDTVGLSDLHIEEKLTRLIHGGRRYDAASTSLDTGGLDGVGVTRIVGAGARGAAGVGVGGVGVGGSGRPGMPGGSAPGGGGAGPGAWNDAEACSTILEGDRINVNVTSPGAMLALALMYLGSNDANVAARLKIPDTMFLLDYVRPDLLLLRALGRSLVLWDSIEPTVAWLVGLVPEAIRDDAQASAYIMAGGCMAVGLRFAGTQDPRAWSLLLTQVRKLRAIRAGGSYESSDGISWGKLTRPTTDTSLGAVVAAVAMVMAGSGHLETLKVLRTMRTVERTDMDMLYGFHMMLHMSIGLLFLGGGRYTLSNSASSVAALILAFYPTTPFSTRDNRFHLQAYRHLYVLASEHRCVEARDVDTGQPVFVPLRVTLRPSESDGERRSFRVVAPALLPDFDLLSSVTVVSPRYWPLTLEVESNPVHRAALRSRRLIFVKRKTGFLTYEQDPMGLRSILSRSFPKEVGPRRPSSEKRTEFVKAFSADSNVLAFAQHFCAEGNAFGRFCTDVLYECLTREKPEMLQSYLSIYQIVRNLEHATDSLSVWDVKLVLEYYAGDSQAAATRDRTWTHEPLLQREFLEGIALRIDDVFRGRESLEQQAVQYVADGTLPQDGDAVMLCNYLTWVELPHRSRVREGVDPVLHALGLKKEAAKPRRSRRGKEEASDDEVANPLPKTAAHALFKMLLPALPSRCLALLAKHVEEL